MQNFLLRHLCTNASVITILAALLAVPKPAISAEEGMYDVSRSWFRPSLAVNNDPEIGAALLNGYMKYFRSTETTNPLEADFNGRREQTDSIAHIARNLHELEWKETQINEVHLRIAEINLDDDYYAIVRRYYSIGWREGFYYDILINKPLSEYGLTEENYAQYFSSNHFGVLAPTSDRNVFDVVYRGDPRFFNYQSSILVNVANMYIFKGSLYLSLRTDQPQPNTYMVCKVLDHKTLYLTCTLVTTPSNSLTEAQRNELPAFSELKRDLHDMMGSEGDCGTLHALGNASGALGHALDTMLYRPWSCTIPPDWRLFSEDQTDRRQIVDRNIDLWGHSGIWEYHKYRSYLSHLTGAEQEIKGFYAEKFALSEEEAGALAYSAISYALVVGFDHGRIDDVAHELHKKILEGMSADELKEAEISKESDTYTESLLTFAIERPELLKVLLAKGLNPNAQNGFGKTPLMYAAQFDALEAAKMLLEHGASTEASTIDSDDRCTYTIRAKYVTALHYAVRYSSRDLIELLLKYGAPTYFADSEGFTPYDYLVHFGGYEGYKQVKKGSYGDANQNLTADDRRELKVALLPPDSDKKLLLSRQENLKAEKMYREGKLEEAYRALTRAISLNPDNERSLSNLSLVTLKLGRLGESAKISTMLVKKAKSDTERANAYFNLGLACRDAGITGFHYSTLQYDGRNYCGGDFYGKDDQTALSSFLMAYKLEPSQDRLNAILSLVQDVDIGRRKRAWKFSDDGTGLKALYSTGGSLNFLVDSSKEVPFKSVFSRYGSQDDRPLTVKRKEIIPLTRELKLERWFVEYIWVPLRLDGKICTPAFPVAFDDDVKLIEVFSSSPVRPPSPSRNITLKQAVSIPVVLVLYGNNLAWRLEGDLSKTVGVYVHGRSTVQLPSESGVPAFTDKEAAYEDPRGSSFNPQTRSIIGLMIDSIIDVRKDEMTVLTDAGVAESKYEPRAPSAGRPTVVGNRGHTAAADGCSSDQSVESERSCLQRELERIDEEINKIYQEVLSGLGLAEKDNLRNQQRAWLRLRNSECKLQPRIYDRTEWFRHVLSDDDRALCVVRLTKERLAYLNALKQKQEAQQRANESLRVEATIVPSRSHLDYKRGSSESHRTGKWYFEVQIDHGKIREKLDATLLIGIGDGERTFGTMYHIRPMNTVLKIGEGSITIVGGNLGEIRLPKVTVGIAADLDNGKLYHRRDGRWRVGIPGTAQGIDVKLGCVYKGQIISSLPLDSLIKEGIVCFNFGDRPFCYPIPDGYALFDSKESGALIAPTQLGNVKILAPGSLIDGQPPTYWVRRFFEWSRSFPQDAGPWTDSTGARCGGGQSYPVWFLPGSESTDPVTRSCDIPANVHVMVSVLRTVAQPTRGKSVTCEQLIEPLQKFCSEVSDLYLKVNGVSLKNVSLYRAGTECFDLKDVSTGEKRMAAGDGYWIFLEPLPPGHHEIEYGGKYLTDGFTQNIKYQITVK